MISSEQLSLELHQVEREIGKRTRELSMESQSSLEVKSKVSASKQTENGQQSKVPSEDLALTFSIVLKTYLVQRDIFGSPTSHFYSTPPQKNYS
ncbi:roquin-1-like [Rhineura floridana]|nr:roquin-1-like [Rhineura floridana]